MGSSSWSSADFTSYVSTAYRGAATVLDSGEVKTNLSCSQLYRANRLDEALNPYKVLRECRDSEEHPNTLPVILALDVTGSMGKTAEEVAKQLNVIISELYEQLSDVEFLVMGIGDLAYDAAPIQAGQFESDIRIAEQLGKIYFEFGGGSNPYESYTAAWYFGLHHTSLDCWKRGKKGIIITMGDEKLNPYLPCDSLTQAVGYQGTTDIDTKKLYVQAKEKYDIYHINVLHRSNSPALAKSWRDVIGENYKEATLNELPNTIIDIITSVGKSDTAAGSTGINVTPEGIAW